MIFKFLNKERMLSKMKRKLMICAMALCICAGLTGNTGEVSVWASEESSSDAVRIGALKGPTAMGMAQLLDEDGYDFTIAASPDEIVPMVVQDKLDIAAVPQIWQQRCIRRQIRMSVSWRSIRWVFFICREWRQCKICGGS